MLWGGGDIDDDLGEFGNDGGELGESFAGGSDGFGNHETSEDAVAGGVAGEDDVAVLFGADVDVFCEHGGDDVGVADISDLGVDVGFFGPVQEALAGHDGGDDGV